MRWRTGIRWTPQGDAVLRRVMMVRRRADHSRHTDRELGTFRLSGQSSIRGCDGAELSEVASIVPTYRGKSLPDCRALRKAARKYARLPVSINEDCVSMHPGVDSGHRLFRNLLPNRQEESLLCFKTASKPSANVPMRSGNGMVGQKVEVWRTGAMPRLRLAPKRRGSSRITASPPNHGVPEP
jgi:hypothetical protein